MSEPNASVMPAHDPVRADAPDGAGSSARRLTVYHDGACPVCAREIAVYRRRDRAGAIEWVDASSCDETVLGSGLSREAALARLHARRADGTLVDGAAAFAEIWRRLPGLGWLGRVAAAPGVLPMLEAGYRGFLRVRPLWRRPAGDACALPRELVADLRTDHAGETGAVMIYRGVLAVASDPALRAFAERHLATESDHLARIEAVLPHGARSRLLPAWRLAGWLTGSLPALAGPRAVHATIAAVETFVDRHYAGQIARIDRLDPQRSDPRLQALRALLQACRDDEIGHRDEAAAAFAQHGSQPGVALRAWTALVGAGSAAAVSVCRRL